MYWSIVVIFFFYFRMSKLVETVSKKTLAPHVHALVFELCASDLAGQDLEVPYVRYVINRKGV